MGVITAVIVLGILGLLFGLGLALASKKFFVDFDPRLEKVLSFLPGSNCGACGSAGCAAFAQSLINGKAALEACRGMEEKAREEAAGLLGVELKETARKIAVLNCGGSRKIVKDKFYYNGLPDCIGANLVLGGQKECRFACLGFGSCEKICPFGAITMSEQGLPAIDPKKCTGCGKCVAICPKGVLSLIPISGRVRVACSSCANARKTAAVCSVGCIACRKCEKVCPADAIRVTNNLARIDYHKCTLCGECVKACPMKCIIMEEER